MDGVSAARFRYCSPPPDAGRDPMFLVAAHGTREERWYPFYDRLEIGREEGNGGEHPGTMFVSDPTVSRAHCVLTGTRDGRCFVRDTSRNGTRVDGRRLIPNVEVEVHPGQRLSVGDHGDFVVVFTPPAARLAEDQPGTLAVPLRSVVTVLVGDIRDYTRIVREASAAEVQQSVSRIFRILGDAVAAHGGTIKEFQGDALMAFWEGSMAGEQAAAACRAALCVDALAQQLGRDPAAWAVASHLLRMDWALASGPVVIDSFGASQPAGLSMIGEAPILAFRLEKLATDETGRILTCPATKAMACGSFLFRDLGLMTAKGFDRPEHVFALVDARTPAPATITRGAA